MDSGCRREGAWNRLGEPELGEFEEAVILRTFGDVPDDLRFVA